MSATTVSPTPAVAEYVVQIDGRDALAIRTDDEVAVVERARGLFVRRGLRGSVAAFRLDASGGRTPIPGATFAWYGRRRPWRGWHQPR